MKLLLKCLGIYFFFIIICFILLKFWGFFSKKDAKTEYIISVKYMTNDVYKISHFIKDRCLHHMILNDRTMFFYFLFFFNIVLFLIVKILLFFIAFLYFIKYGFLTVFFFFKEKNYYDIELWESDYIIKNNINFLYLPIFLVYFSKWVGFTLNYFLWKTLYNRNNNLNISKIFHSYIFIIFFGISWVNLYIIIKISLDFEILFLNKGLPAFWSIPKVIVFNFTSVFNSYMVNSKKLRIYKENNKVYFNPPKKYIESIFDLAQHTVRVSSPGSKSRHPGILVNKYNDEGCDSSIQMTGKMPKKYEGIEIFTSNYKKNTSFAMYNIVRDSRNIEQDYNQKFLRNIHINNLQKMNDFKEHITLLRSIKSEKTVFEGLDSKEILDINFARYSIENHKKLNTNFNLIKIYDQNINIIDRLSRENLSIYSDFYDDLILDYDQEEHFNVYLGKNPPKEKLEIYKDIKFTFKTEGWCKKLNGDDIDEIDIFSR